MKQNNSIYIQQFLSGNGEEEEYITETEVAVSNGLSSESHWKQRLWIFKIDVSCSHWQYNSLCKLRGFSILCVLFLSAH